MRCDLIYYVFRRSLVLKSVPAKARKIEAELGPLKFEMLIARVVLQASANDFTSQKESNIYLFNCV